MVGGDELQPAGLPAAALWEGFQKVDSFRNVGLVLHGQQLPVTQPV